MRLIKVEPLPGDRVRNTFIAQKGDGSTHPPSSEFEEIISLAPPPTPEELATNAEHDAAAEARITELRPSPVWGSPMDD